MSILKNITEYGVAHSVDPAEKRNIRLSNYISLVAATAALLLIVCRAVMHRTNYGVEIILVQGIFIFLIPIILNYFRFVIISRLLLCWTHAIFLMYAFVATLKQSPSYQTTDYVGLQFFILAFSCFPFLVFEVTRKSYFIAGLLGPLCLLTLYNPILNLFGVGYHQVGLSDESYPFTTVRLIISFFVIGSSTYFLKRLIEKGDALNNRLLAELDEKNKQLRQDAKDEVKQLNEQLSNNLQYLSEREFLLNQSQRIAKIGSWEYRLQDGFIFWSDEMYNIFGLDKNFDLRTTELAKIMWGDESEVVLNATLNLLRTGQDYDLTLRTRTPLGYKKWVRVCAYPVYEKNHAVGVRAICHDITYFKEAEEQLRASEQKFSKVFKQNPDLMTLVREDDLIIYDVNEQVGNVMGYHREELVGQISTNFVFFADEKEKKAFFSEYAAQGKVDMECSWIRKDGRIIQVLIASRQLELEGVKYFISVIRDISDRKAAEQETELARYSLNERVKELTTLYKASQILNREKQPEAVVMQKIADILPDGWQHSAVAAARISIGDQFYATTNFKESPHFQKQTFNLPDGRVGVVEVSYLEPRPPEAEGPFLFEERNLINMIAEMIRIYFDHRHETAELNKSEANLHATINNTEVLIWSVDIHLKLLTFNKPFQQYIKAQYGLDIKVGSRVFDDGSTGQDQSKKWTHHYMRALSGEIITLEEERFETYFHYSLSPIIEREQIIGVSVFADNITERKNKERELAEANEKIGELKLMALRSVMSPHFIFNVLNSIQFFIARNDRLNAINYLSVFSKLIRSILTHSVNKKIRLSEEIDMLKNYVSLELTRFEHKFDFVIIVAPDTDVDGIEIPSLLIQPYVENAILHGLYNKREKGTLTIRIREEDDSVLFEIEDDGVGRAAAMSLKNQNFPTHQSMGLKLTEERLKLINQQHNAAFSIEDLVNEKGPCGTRVLIRVSI